MAGRKVLAKQPDRGQSEYKIAQSPAPDYENAARHWRESKSTESPEIECRAFRHPPNWPACSMEGFLPPPSRRVFLHRGTRSHQAKRRAENMPRGRLDAWPGLFLHGLINDVVARRNRCALRNAVCDNIGDGCGRFNRCHANLPDKLSAALDEELSVADDAVLVSEA